MEKNLHHSRRPSASSCDKINNANPTELIIQSNKIVPPTRGGPRAATNDTQQLMTGMKAGTSLEPSSRVPDRPDRTTEKALKMVCACAIQTPGPIKIEPGRRAAERAEFRKWPTFQTESKTSSHLNEQTPRLLV